MGRASQPNLTGCKTRALFPDADKNDLAIVIDATAPMASDFPRKANSRGTGKPAMPTSIILYDGNSDLPAVGDSGVN